MSLLWRLWINYVWSPGAFTNNKELLQITVPWDPVLEQQFLWGKGCRALWVKKTTRTCKKVLRLGRLCWAAGGCLVILMWIFSLYRRLRTSEAHRLYLPVSSWAAGKHWKLSRWPWRILVDLEISKLAWMIFNIYGHHCGSCSFCLALHLSSTEQG